MYFLDAPEKAWFHFHVLSWDFVPPCFRLTVAPGPSGLKSAGAEKTFTPGPPVQPGLPPLGPGPAMTLLPWNAGATTAA